MANVIAPTNLYTAVAQAACLVEIRASAWSGRITDRQFTDKVEGDNGVEKRSGAYTKKLFPGTNLLRRVTAVQTAFRTYAQARTMPLAGSACRLLANVHLPEFYKMLSKTREEIDAALDEVEENYDSAVALARRQLGPAFNPEDYPSVAEIRERFAVRCDVMPVPQSGHFGKVGLPDGTLDALNDQFEEQAAAKMAAVVSEMEDRAKATARHVKDRIEAIRASQEKAGEGTRAAPLFQSTFDDAKEIGALLADYALIFQSSTLAEIAGALAEIGDCDRKDVRDNPDMQFHVELAARKVLDANFTV